MKHKRTPDWLWGLLRVEFRWGYRKELYLGHWCEICFARDHRLKADIRVWKRRVICGFTRQYSFIAHDRPRMWGITICKWREPTEDNGWSEWEDAWGRGRLGARVGNGREWQHGMCKDCSWWKEDETIEGFGACHIGGYSLSTVDNMSCEGFAKQISAK